MSMGSARWLGVGVLLLVGPPVLGQESEPASAPEKVAPAKGLDTQAIERLTGAKGELDTQEGVFKVSVPRTDLRVSTAGVRMTPRLGETWCCWRTRSTR